jgi:two-component system LytT family response regulator
MKKIRAVIADDEPLARRGIRQLLAVHEDVEVVGEARNGRETLLMLEALAPDLVFLDIQMPEANGFDLLQRIAPVQRPEVIFVTAYDTFAVRAFEERALDYLVKPVPATRFDEALARARARLRARLRRLIIPTSDSALVLDLSEVVWIEAEDYYAAIHVSTRKFLVRESLASLESRLNPTRFVRIHRSAIVNLDFVRQLHDSAVLLRNGTELPVSRRRREQVAEAIRRFAG